MANYDLFSIDLATAGSAPKRLVEISKQIATIYVLSLPAGVNVLLAIGQRQFFPLKFLGQSVRLIPPERDGLYVTVPAAQSGVVQLLVGYQSVDQDATAPEFYGSGLDALTAYNRLASGFASATTAGAGGQAQIQLFNPVGSGVIGLVEEVEIIRSPDPTVQGTVLAVPIRAGRFDTALTTLVASLGWRDGRQAGTPACQVRSSNANIGVVIQEQIPVEDPGRLINAKYALAPGQGHVVQTLGDPSMTMTLVATYRWQEVPQ